MITKKEESTGYLFSLEQKEGQGNFGHSGRPGKVGGSGSVGSAKDSSRRIDGKSDADYESLLAESKKPGATGFKAKAELDLRERDDKGLAELLRDSHGLIAWMTDYKWGSHRPPDTSFSRAIKRGALVRASWTFDDPNYTRAVYQGAATPKVIEKGKAKWENHTVSVSAVKGGNYPSRTNRDEGERLAYETQRLWSNIGRGPFIKV